MWWAKLDGNENSQDFKSTLWLSGRSYDSHCFGFFFMSTAKSSIKKSLHTLTFSLSVSQQSWTTQRPGWQKSMLWCIGSLRRTDRCWSFWWNTWLSRRGIWPTSTVTHYYAVSDFAYQTNRTVLAVALSALTVTEDYSFCFHLLSSAFKSL